MLRLAFLLIPLVIVSGCTFYTRNIPPDAVKKIQLNVTTQEQVFKTFGRPIRTGVDSGYETWRYLYRGFDKKEFWVDRELYLIFNKDRTVHKYSFGTDKPAFGDTTKTK